MTETIELMLLTHMYTDRRHYPPSQPHTCVPWPILVYDLAETDLDNNRPPLSCYFIRQSSSFNNLCNTLAHHFSYLIIYGMML